MEEYTTCPYCGSERESMDAVKCPECKRTYPDKEERLMGLPVNDIAAFVEKNQSRYMHIFKTHEGKKRFRGWNWAAALVPAPWMFYRKMYRQGVVYLVISNAISIVLSILILLCFSGTLSEMKQASLDYTEWDKVATELRYENPLGQYKTNPEYIEATENLNAAKDIVTKAATTVLLVTGITSFAVSIVTLMITGLYGDCIYYHHVRKNATHIRDGGTSVGGMIGALILASIITSMVESVVNFFVALIF